MQNDNDDDLDQGLQHLLQRRLAQGAAGGRRRPLWRRLLAQLDQIEEALDAGVITIGEIADEMGAHRNSVSTALRKARRHREANQQAREKTTQPTPSQAAKPLPSVPGAPKRRASAFTNIEIK